MVLLHASFTENVWSSTQRFTLYVYCDWLIFHRKCNVFVQTSTTVRIINASMAESVSIRSTTTAANASMTLTDVSVNIVRIHNVSYVHCI